MGTLPEFKEEVFEPSFDKPHALKKDPVHNHMVIDEEKSEICVLLEALGGPRVFYAAKKNGYFRDMAFKNPYTDAEIQALKLPLPIELETKRRKLMENAMKAGKLLTQDELYGTTLPTVLLPPDHINARLTQIDPVDKMINKINRATIGK
jgi:hypothetical protein